MTMQNVGTTVRIRTKDKAKLDDLCRLTSRGIVHMLAYLIEREHEAQTQNQQKPRRKAG